MRSALITWMMAGALAACSVGASAQVVEFQDARGKTIRLPQPAQRIITLAPNLTELVYAAGAGRRLAGVSRFSDYPPAAQRLPIVSDAAYFDVERMLALRADLVLAWQGGTPPEAVARIERAGLPVFVAAAARLEDIAHNLEAVARLAGSETEGLREKSRFENELRELRKRKNSGTPVRVFYEIWQRPLMSINHNHLISEIITLCGGVNVFGGLQPLTPEVSREALMDARPDMVLGGSSADTPESFSARWAALPPPFSRWPARHVPADLIKRPTPRVLDGAKLVCAHLDAVREARR